MMSNHNSYQMFIDGSWQPARAGGELSVFNPATGEAFASVSRGSPADVDAAVTSAKKGLAAWRRTHPAERARILYQIAQTLRARAREFAELESENGGGGLQGSLNTVNDVCARRFEFYAGLADKIQGSTFVAPDAYFSYTTREPIGITAHIIPWNGPLWIGSRTIAPALAAGNAVIAKPSMEAPLSLLKFAELAYQCGLPAGAFNVITGQSSEIGDALTSHPDVSAIYFTGSGFTARHVLKKAAEHFVPGVIELGGKSPNIVLADADLDAALYGALWAIFANAGQICVAGSRLLVHARIHDEFVDRLAALARGLRLGGPKDNADVGPLISANQRKKVLEYIATGRSEANLILGGGTPTDPALLAGYYVQPTIFDAVPTTAKIAREEIFGPVLTVTAFSEIDEAIAIANASDYGLASAVWTNDLRAAHHVAQSLDSGQVYINHYFTISYELSRTPYKASGFGHSEGPEAINEYLRTKVVSVNMKRK
jgi:aldehyde dehydrogenase (NAD+)